MSEKRFILCETNSNNVKLPKSGSNAVVQQSSPQFSSNNICNIQDGFSKPTHKHEKLHYITSETIKGGRQLIVNYLDQSFNLANQELVLDYVVPFANHTIVCANAG